jgi:hypothetical protein
MSLEAHERLHELNHRYDEALISHSHSAQHPLRLILSLSTISRVGKGILIEWLTHINETYHFLFELSGDEELTMTLIGDEGFCRFAKDIIRRAHDAVRQNFPDGNTIYFRRYDPLR